MKKIIVFRAEQIQHLKKFVCLFLFLSIVIAQVRAQNVSYNLNSIPIVGTDNTAFGFQSLFSNATGIFNTAVGKNALFSSTNSYGNIAIGYNSLYSTTRSTKNIGIGNFALYNLTVGSFDNIAIGDSTMSGLVGNIGSGRNTAVGGHAMISPGFAGDRNVALGYNAQITPSFLGLDNAVAIGANSVATLSNSIQLGDGNITKVFAGTGTTATVISGGLQITGGSIAPGKVLMSDAFGVATWQTVSGGGPGSGWNLNGNGGTVDATDFVGTTDNAPLNFRVNNVKAGRLDPILNNAFYGILSGSSNTTGTNNTIFGTNANVSSGALTNATALGNGAVVTGSNAIQLGNSSVTQVFAGTGTTAKLIAGGLQITGGTLSTGYVLTSDASGNATWQAPGGGGGTSWDLSGNAGTIDGVNFIGTTDNVPLNFRVNNQKAGRIDPALNNSFFGFTAGNSNTAGTQNTAVGEGALALADASRNTAIGYLSLYNNKNGNDNTAVGTESLIGNLTGNQNTAIGKSALASNSIASNNTAVGFEPLFSNTLGYGNVGLGISPLYNNIDGAFNIAIGTSALHENTSGVQNIAIGDNSLFNTDFGGGNVAVGSNTLIGNTTGVQNTAVGLSAMLTNVTGSANTALGVATDVSSTGLTNSSAIGAFTIVNASNKIRFGDPSVTVIEGTVMYTFSDGRFKTNIKEEDVKGLDFINRLRPVVYNLNTKKIQEFLVKSMPDSSKKKYFENRDFAPSTAIRQSGFIAQEVEKAAKEAGYDFNGVHVPETKDDNYSLAYSEFTVPLVKAVQELSRQNDSLKKQMAELKAMITAVAANKNMNGSIRISESNESAKLYQNAPNPFNKSTLIKYSIPENAKKAVIIIADNTGRKIKEYNIKGNTGLNISGGQLAAGIYIYSMYVDDILIDSKQMILTK